MHKAEFPVRVCLAQLAIAGHGDLSIGTSLNHRHLVNLMLTVFRVRCQSLDD
jgi:hypothetical protein